MKRWPALKTEPLAYAPAVASRLMRSALKRCQLLNTMRNVRRPSGPQKGSKRRPSNVLVDSEVELRKWQIVFEMENQRCQEHSQEMKCIKRTIETMTFCSSRLCRLQPTTTTTYLAQ